MDQYLERIQNLATTDQCETFARNALNAKPQRHDLAIAAYKRAIEILTAQYTQQHNTATLSEVEKACISAVYAYERCLSLKNGRKTRANRTWQMIQRHGILQAAERAVDRPEETLGYQTLVEAGLGEFAFEHIIVRYPDQFSVSAVQRSAQRLGEMNS